MLDLNCAPDDVRDAARLVNALRDGDTPEVLEPLIVAASADPERFLAAAVRLLLAYRSPDTTDPGLGLHYAAANVAHLMERRASERGQ